MPFLLRCIVNNVVGKILNIPRIVIDPRQSHTLHLIKGGIPGVGGRGVVGAGCAAEVKFVDINIIESIIKILLAPPLQELRLDLGLGDFGDSDRAELVEALVAYLTVEYNLLSSDIGTVDMPEDSDILRAIVQRKGNSEGVTVTT